jgi:hypothetical protein
MSRYYRSSLHSSYRQSGSYNKSNSEKHVREAKELSERLGGTDEDVKQYFFSLPPSTLDAVFKAYGRKYNRPSTVNSKLPNAEQYARRTYNQWASGQRRMSGLVAGRLFDLLPPIMPADDKHRLVERLWRTYSPKSTLFITVGLSAEASDFLDQIKTHLEQAVVSYTIPEPLETRFIWLAEGDVSVKQQLLNHFLHQERKLISHGLDAKIPILLTSFKQFEGQIHGMTETITIGGHCVEVCFDKTKEGVSISKHRPPSQLIPTSNSSKSGCLTMIIIMFVLGLTTWLANM